MTTINLNDYQRDNLIWLLHLIRCGHTDNYLNTGDWVAEIEWQLCEFGFDPAVHKPNLSVEAFLDLKDRMKKDIV